MTLYGKILFAKVTKYAQNIGLFALCPIMCNSANYVQSYVRTHHTIPLLSIIKVPQRYS